VQLFLSGTVEFMNSKVFPPRLPEMGPSSHPKNWISCLWKLLSVYFQKCTTLLIKGCAFLQLKKRLIAKVLFCFRKAEYKTASLSVPDLAIYYSNTTLGVRVCFNNIENIYL